AFEGGRGRDTLTADLLETAPDHIVVTGDIINISLPNEYALAQAWLRSLGAPDRVTVIPGNHDAYVPIDWRQSIGLWADYMTGARPGADAREQPGRSDDDFPFARVRRPLAPVGVS